MAPQRATVRARPPRVARHPEPVRDADVLEAYLEDASAFPGGRAAGLLRTDDPEETAAWLGATAGRGLAALPQAARSSLTGGAVPNDEVVLSCERWTDIGAVRERPGGASVEVAAGVRLRGLQSHLASRGFYFPPVPTYLEAMIGGTVATNAGGAATFKYGVTRDWVAEVRVILPDGSVLDVARGEAVARRGDVFVIERPGGPSSIVPVPDWTLPPLRKVTAGYHAADPLDLVDLFVGSEGTLGVIASVTLDLVPRPAATVTGLLFVGGRFQLLRVARSLREAASAARARGDARGPDVRSVESLDARCLDLLRVHGDARKLRIDLPEEAGGAILFEAELPEPVTDAEAVATLEAYLDGGPRNDTPLGRICAILAREGVLDRLELALPEDLPRQAAYLELRESVPKRVNEILAARRRLHPAVRKMGGDFIVSVDLLDEMVAIYEDGFERRGLEYAVWGHVSDGNLHPNALARDANGMESAREALLEFAEAAASRGGAPLSEHGVGRSPLKQEMLRRFLGDAALASMRRIKAALDPEGRMAPGVVFPRAPAPSS